MKYLFPLIFSLILVCASPQASYGAFWRHHATSQITTASTSSDSTRQSRNMQNAFKGWRKNRLLKALFVDDQHSKSGWAGITSLICGAFGILFIPAIAAIIFGAIGQQKDRKFRWMAIVGIYLGIFFFLLIGGVLVYMVFFF